MTEKSNLLPRGVERGDACHQEVRGDCERAAAAEQGDGGGVANSNQEQTETSQKTKIESLQRKIDSTTANYTALRKRRNLDLEGFTHDIANVRRQLKSLERQVLKYAPADDHELNLLVLARETGEQVNKIADELQNMKTGCMGVVGVGA
ncbi:hypothetical protein BC938DRAFT_472443 [Jimgerdemannia flammicorona]|uniref:Uncharacterized protein n=1 Tax=Jimgerdemannia flammicorona TaxID=994334 RepID=A0A433Q637_9FUNG|nr:hypothetical protein BC938DRAFT_472443 [Jimgerdemannia flammicorona]